MRTLILIALLLISLLLRAQDSIPNNSCKANFIYAVNYEIMTFAPATVLNFYDLSDGKAINWFWDFGDGYTSYEQNPMHIFNLPIPPPESSIPPNPYRTVSLTIFTADSCFSTYSETINIFDQYTEPDPRCKAEFKHYTLFYDTIAGTETFQFSNRSEGESLSYLWQFDNGGISTEAEPTITYDFKEPIHKVSLTITGTDGCIDSYGEDVFVNYPDGYTTDPLDTIYNGCFVDFGYTINYDIQTYAPALVLDFYTKSNDEIVSWYWNFGDGYTSNESNPTHIFNYPVLNDSIMGDPNSLVMVCLNVTTASGCESSFCQLIDIYTGTTPHETYCHPWFKGYIPSDVVTIPEVVPFQFTDGSEGDVISWLWQFEDGTTRSEREPLVMFDSFRPRQKVCLTITTADSCASTWCETVYVTHEVVDTFGYDETTCNYTFKYTSYYPEMASACIGTASAQVVLKDSLIPTEFYYWSTYNEGIISNGPNVTNLCPTQTYTVTARTTDGCKFSGSFIFNSDGTLTEIPANWWIYMSRDDSYVNCNIYDNGYTVEWVLCDGSTVTSDNIRLSEIDCGTNEANFFLKDTLGNVVYSENLRLKAKPVSFNSIKASKMITLYPVPVVDLLNIKFNSQSEESIRFEISDLSGRALLNQNFRNVQSGQLLRVDVSSLQKGIYLGKIIAENRIIAVEKFSK